MTDHSDLYWPWYGAKAAALVKLPDSPGPATCPPQPFSRVPFTRRLLHAHRWDVCLYRGQASGCYQAPRLRCQGVVS